MRKLNLDINSYFPWIEIEYLNNETNYDGEGPIVYVYKKRKIVFDINNLESCRVAQIYEGNETYARNRFVWELHMKSGDYFCCDIDEFNPDEFFKDKE